MKFRRFSIRPQGPERKKWESNNDRWAWYYCSTEHWRVQSMINWSRWPGLQKNIKKCQFFYEFLKVWSWAINIKNGYVLKSNERGTVLMWILWCLDYVLVTCSPVQYFNKLMNRTLKNDAEKGSWQDSWKLISVKWMYYKEKEEKLWIVFFPCDSALSLRGT